MLNNLFKLLIYSLLAILCYSLPEAAAGERLSIARTASSGNLTIPKTSTYEVISDEIRVVTAYNVGDPDQNWGDPCISASGEDLCNALNSGQKRCAANFVPIGTELHIEDFGVYRVSDRMHRRFKNRVDIAMKRDELKKAKVFGKKRLRVKILRKRAFASRPIFSN
ncbi:MAG: hypothetical protein V3S66_10140 [Desulfobacterales bacterium]